MVVGQWNSNSILFKEILSSGGQEVAMAFAFGQPRSITLGNFEGRTFMFVGTSEGLVVFFELLVSLALFATTCNV